MDRKTQGGVSQSFCVAYFADKNYIVSQTMFDDAKYDLIVDDGTRLLKVQCKTSHYKNIERLDRKHCKTYPMINLMKKVKKELKDIPVATMDDLEWADGIAFGTPTRYGNMSAQMKQFIDQTGNLWQRGALENKVAGVFTSTATQHGGQETTIITSMVPLLHLGMIIVGVPYSEQRLFAVNTVGGGSPYGASSVSGPMANRESLDNDIEIAKTFGRRIAEIAKKIAGK